MSWREKLAALPEAERQRGLVACDEQIAQMSEEELTLWLAREGCSPEDTRRGLQRALNLIDAAKDERNWEEFELARFTNEGGR